MMRRIFKLAALAAGVGLYGFLAERAVAQNDSIDAAPTQVSIAYCVDCIPFQFQDPSGEAAGLLIDLWRLWSERTGIEVSFAAGKWNDALSAVRNGDADIHAGLFYSEERDAFLDFAAPLRAADAHFFFHKSITGLTDAEGLAAYRVGALKNDFTGGWLKRTFPGLAIAEFDNYQDMLAAAENSEIRVFANLTTTLLYMMSEAGIRENYRFQSNQPLFTMEWTSAVAEGNIRIQQLINNGMVRITDAERTEIAKRWSGGGGATRDRLVIAIDRSFPPITLINAVGEPAGLVVDMWRLWAEKTGQKIEFFAGSWSETLNALESGEADIHSGMFLSEERKTQIDFSTPYYALASNIYFRLTDGAPQSLDDLVGRRVGLIRGTFNELYVRDKYPGIDLALYDDDEQLIKAALNKEVDAVVSEELSVDAALDNLGVRGEFGRADQPLYENQLHAGVQKGNGELLALVNQGLGEITESERREIESHWLAEGRIDYTMIWRGIGVLVLVLLLVGIWMIQNLRQRRLLTEAADNLRRILEASPVGVSMIDTETKARKFVNPSVMKMFGAQTIEEMDSVPMSETFVDPNELDRLTKILDSGEPISGDEVVRKRLDGTPWWSFQSSTTAEYQGRQVHIIWSFDITERKQAEEEIRQNEENLRRILESSPCGVSINSIDNRTRKYFNPRLVEMFGAEAESDLLGRDPAHSYVDAADYKNITQLLKTQHAVRSREVERKRVDDTAWWCLLDSFEITYRGEPALIHWHYDITERKRAEQRVRESEKRLAQILEDSPIGVSVTGVENQKLLFTNRRMAEMFGTTEEALRETDPKSMWVDADQRKHAMAEFASAGKFENREVLMRQANGTQIWDLMSILPMEFEGQESFLAWHYDITERKRAEERVRDSEQRLARILEDSPAGVSIVRAADGKVVFSNPRIRQLMRLSSEDTTDLNARDFYADADERRSVTKALDTDGTIRDRELQMRRVDGSAYPALTTISAFEFEGEPAWLSWLYDITERKEAEAEVTRQSQIMSDVLDNIAQGVVKYDSDRNMVVWNQHYQEMLRLPDDAVGVGRSAQNITRHLAYRGDYGEGNPEALSDQRLEALWRRKASRNELVVGGDKIYDALLQPTDDGGVVITYTDITERKKAEQELADFERLLRTVIDSVPAIITVKDRNSRFLLVNQMQAEELGCAPQDAIGKRRDDFPRPGVSSDEDGRYTGVQFDREAEVMRTGEPDLFYEEGFKRADGATEHRLVSKIPLRDSADQVNAVLTVALDISERKRAEQLVSEQAAALQAASDQLQLAMDSMSDGIFRLDSDLNYMLFNDRYIDLLELPENLIEIGSPFSVVLDYQAARGDFGSDSAEAISSLITNYKSGEATLYERTMYNGRILEFRRAPVSDGGVVSVISDITERKRAEQLVKESEQRLLAILETSPIGVSIVNTETQKLIFANPRQSELFGYEETHFDELDVTTLYVDRSALTSLQKRLARQETVHDLELRMRRTDGEIFWALASYYPVDFQGQPARINWFYDITSLKDVQAELASKEEQLRMAMDNMPGGMVVWDSDLKLVRCNHKFMEYFQFPEKLAAPGSSAEDFLRFNVSQGGYGDVDIDQFVNDRMAEYRSGDPISAEVTTASGRVITIDYQSTPEGSMVGIFGDITERKKAEEAVRESERRLLSILEQSPVGAAITRRRDGKYLFGSDRFAEMLGLSVDTLLARGAGDVYVDPGIRPGIVAEIEKRGFVQEREVKLRRRGADNFDALMSMYPSEHGGESSYIVWISDITERKRAQEKLAEALSVIRESVDYASNIQRSLLPAPTELEASLGEHFILWQPRDVVGGDIYWLRPCDGGHLLIVCDCTGHGIPGAFMTLIGNGALNHALVEHPNGDPGAVLRSMNRYVKHVLRQDREDEGEADDGMELGLCRINAADGQIVFAGARTSLFVLNDGQVEEIRGDRSSIGYRKADSDYVFANHDVPITPGMALYIATDGITDQVGGPRRRMFGKKRFIQTLIDNADAPMAAQRDAIYQTFEGYQGDEARRDDVTLLGFRLGR